MLETFSKLWTRNDSAPLRLASNDIIAEGNWWGTSDEDSIAAIIWDYYDNNDLGIVDYRPFREYEIAGTGSGGIQSNSDDAIVEFGFEVPAIINQCNIILTYQAPLDERATVKIYDITGRLAKKILLKGSGGVKQYGINWAGLSGGLYFIWYKTDTYSKIRKVILVK